MLIRSSTAPFSKRNTPSKTRFTNGSTMTIITPKMNEAAKAFNLIATVNSSSILLLVIEKINNEIRKSVFVIVFATSLSMKNISKKESNIKTIIPKIIPNPILLKYLGNKRKLFCEEFII